MFYFSEHVNIYIYTPLLEKDGLHPNMPCPRMYYVWTYIPVEKRILLLMIFLSVRPKKETYT